MAAQSGHDVTIADLSEDLLNKSKAGIEKSLNRVIKKKYAEDQEVRMRKILTLYMYIF